MQNQLRVCEYCQTMNPGKNNSCMACGGPLSKNKIEEIPMVKKVNPSKVIENKPIKKTVKAGKEIGGEVNAVYLKSLSAYSLVWRTLGEAIIIALISFSMGIIGGVLRFPIITIVFSVSFGVVVGLVVKSYLWYLVGTPIGFLLGGVFGYIFHLMGFGRVIILISVFIFSSLSVILGAKLRKSAQKTLYEKLRPIIGGIGGLIFALIGLAIGWGVISLIS